MDSPRPALERPKPASESPEPASESPEPASEIPKPASDSPELGVIKTLALLHIVMTVLPSDRIAKIKKQLTTSGDRQFWVLI